MKRDIKKLKDDVGFSLGVNYFDIIGEKDFLINKKDKGVLKGLTSVVAAIASDSIQEEKKELWYRHNSLQETRPLIFCDPEYGWYEVIKDKDLKCKGALARIWEFLLRKEIFWGTSMGDDRVVEKNFKISYIYNESDFGMQTILNYPSTNGAYSWDAPLKDYNDMDKLHFREIRINYKKSEELFELAEEIMGDCLKIKRVGIFWWSLGMGFDLVKLRGLNQIMLDVYDHPKEFSKLMAFLRDDNLKKLDFLEENGLLSLNNEGTRGGSGGFGWTHELPQKDFDGINVRTIDLWGFLESQETISISPKMFEEFIFPFQLPILERFGLNSYGCCEPLDKRFHIIKNIPRLRRVSVSPWANIENMAEKLGKDYIYSWKQLPTVIASPNIDEESIRKELRALIKKTRNCCVEIIMKDNHTIGQNPNNIIRWCRIAREEAENI